MFPVLFGEMKERNVKSLLSSEVCMCKSITATSPLPSRSSTHSITHSCLLPNLTTNSSKHWQPHFLFSTKLQSSELQPRSRPAIGFELPVTHQLHYLTPSSSSACAHFNLDSLPTDFGLHMKSLGRKDHTTSHTARTSFTLHFSPAAIAIVS